jgi:hypothetical protein
MPTRQDYYLSFKGEISMSKDIFDDLMENELRFLCRNATVEGGYDKFISDKKMLKDNVREFYYEDGVMIINSEHGKMYYYKNEIFELVASKLGDEDMGYAELVDDNGDRWSYWLAKCKVESREWNKPQYPDWFKG